MGYELFTPLRFVEQLSKKQCLGPKLAGVWARRASKKFGTRYLFLQSLWLDTSNLVHNLGLGSR